MKKSTFLLVLSSLALLTSCGVFTPLQSGTGSSSDATVSSSSSSAVASTSSVPSDSPSSSTTASSSGSVTSNSGSSSSGSSTSSSSSSGVTQTETLLDNWNPSSYAYDSSGFSLINDNTGESLAASYGVYSITEAGSYTASGTLKGMIYINVPETDEGSNDVELNLAGVNISYACNSTIYCESADGLDISAKKDTENTLTDLRSVQTADEEWQGAGTLYSKVDTKLKGAGTLSVVGTYNNGIHVTKDLTIQKQTLTAKAINNAIKGSDSITVNSGTITAISIGGDGFKTSDSDVSSKGNQRGDVTFLGGTINIYSACDGVQAAHDFILGAEGSSEGPTVTIKTNKYSSYTDESAIVSSDSENFYIRTTSRNDSYRYSVYFYDSSSYVWADATYLTSKTGGRSTYYYYKVTRPSSYSNFRIYMFNSSAENSTSSYVAVSSGNTVNSNYDTVAFSRSGTSISVGNWSNYTSSTSGNWGGGGFPGGGEFPGGSEGNTDKADVSAKGVKAQNDIYVNSGSIDIEAYDDGLHANYGETLDSGATSTGDLKITGGTVVVSASDDGIHADRYLIISGGDIKVNKSYEALEGNQITVAGGNIYVIASDDGVNAGNGTGTAGLSSKINVTGGYMFVAVPTSGDTDGIDSNGAYTQSGGVVIVGGPSKAGGAAALDTDGSITVSGGTLAVFGSVEKTVSYSGVTYTNKGGSYSANKVYTLKYANGTVATPSMPYAFSGLVTYSSYGSLSTVS